MNKYSRRDFGKIALAGVPLMRMVGGITVGVQTYSYRALPHVIPDDTDVVINALKADNAGEIELYSPGIEPSPGPGVNRESLRQWRLSTPMDHFVAVRRKFGDAGVKIHSYTVNYDADFTDDEIEKTFDQAKALGTNIVATSTRVNMAPKLLAVAEKHKMLLAFHGASNTKDANEFATPKSFQKALDQSKYSRINLDIGHFSAAGYDPVAFIQQHHDTLRTSTSKTEKRTTVRTWPGAKAIRRSSQFCCF